MEVEINLVDFWRGVLIFVCSYGAVALAWRLFKARKDATFPMKILMWAVWWMLVAVCIRSVEAINQNDGFVIGLIPFTIGTILLFIWLMLPYRAAVEQLRENPFQKEKGQ